MLVRIIQALNPARWITKLCACWLSSPYSEAGQNKKPDDQLASCSSNSVAPASAPGMKAAAAMNGSATEPNSTSHSSIVVHGQQHAQQQLYGSKVANLSPASLQHFQRWAKFGHQRAAWSEAIRDQVHSWGFSAFDLHTKTHGNPLITVTLTLLELYELLDGWKLNRRKVENYLLRVESEYNQTSYHNNTHAADVTQTAIVIMQDFKNQVKEISKQEYFSIIIAAAVHDLGHLGVNNDFLVNSRHPRATTYNDKSVNENFHISRAFEIARESSELDIFEGFTADEQKQIRKLMIETVLSTDMAVHFDLLKRYKEGLAATPDLSEWKDRTLLFQMLVHLADIANPSRPFHLAKGWAERVIEEFCDQGDKEAKIGLPVSPMCNRAIMNMPKAQIGFIDIFLKPTLICFKDAAPEFVKMALEHLEITIQRWQELDAAGLTLPPHLAAPLKDGQ